ncbi:hypothetical protein J7M23_03345 [Candidatus Sumerlaeota bacterium]|nr:hypothetical protein [Candidatus Sumerlaeota bacterium]
MGNSLTLSTLITTGADSTDPSITKTAIITLCVEAYINYEVMVHAD